MQVTTVSSTARAAAILGMTFSPRVSVRPISNPRTIHHNRFAPSESAANVAGISASCERQVRLGKLCRDFAPDLREGLMCKGSGFGVQDLHAHVKAQVLTPDP